MKRRCKGYNLGTGTRCSNTPGKDFTGAFCGIHRNSAGSYKEYETAAQTKSRLLTKKVLRAIEIEKRRSRDVHARVHVQVRICFNCKSPATKRGTDFRTRHHGMYCNNCADENENFDPHNAAHLERLDRDLMQYTINIDDYIDID